MQPHKEPELAPLTIVAKWLDSGPFTLSRMSPGTLKNYLVLLNLPAFECHLLPKICDQK